MPTNSGGLALAGVTRIRTLPSRLGEYSQPTPGDPRWVGSVANAHPEVENSWTPVVTYPASRWVRSAQTPVPPAHNRTNATSTSNAPSTTAAMRPPVHPEGWSATSGRSGTAGVAPEPPSRCAMSPTDGGAGERCVSFTGTAPSRLVSRVFQRPAAPTSGGPPDPAPC